MLLISLLTIAAITCGVAQEQPKDSELRLLVGPPTKCDILGWDIDAPTRKALPIYEIKRAEDAQALINAWAERFNVNGKIMPIPPGLAEAPGLWIKEMLKDNSGKWKCVAYSYRTGNMLFTSGDDGHRWDLKNKKPLIKNVPNRKEAEKMVVKLAGELGIGSHNFQLDNNGRLDCDQRLNVLRYYSRELGFPTEIVKKRTIVVKQTLPFGSLYSVGDAGKFEVGFITDGEISDCRYTYVVAEPKYNKLGVGTSTIESRARRGLGHSWISKVKKGATVSDWDIVYPMSDTGMISETLWPYYRLYLKDKKDSNESMTLVVPAWPNNDN